MKTLFDSSVLVALCVQKHPKHESARQWFEKVKSHQMQAVIASHSLIETYSVLTRAPFKPKIGAADAKAMMERNFLSDVELIFLVPDDYKKIVDQLSGSNFIGGISYDAIILECALKSNAQQVVTANPDDFSRLKKAFGYNVDVIGI